MQVSPDQFDVILRRQVLDDLPRAMKPIINIMMRNNLDRPTDNMRQDMLALLHRHVTRKNALRECTPQEICKRFEVLKERVRRCSIKLSTMQRPTRLERWTYDRSLFMLHYIQHKEVEKTVDTSQEVRLYEDSDNDSNASVSDEDDVAMQEVIEIDDSEDIILISSEDDDDVLILP
ncbi:hypothetical protein QAD02_003633 [Eretmocerus hayati]|uniref:Uncharacterized protein n=1 Tax=Eretmocerus hayati TaxID=131215 RepID=A0ACC2NMQ4_9HYME|nr:hypothetical protein QAD02_003633 [Eretmocerus hayati]